LFLFFCWLSHASENTLNGCSVKQQNKDF
jgi:hypothetical protein